MILKTFNMKKLIAISIFFSISFFSQAQNNNKIKAPSDLEHGFTYDFDKANELVIDRLINPCSSNEDVAIIIENKTFPKPVNPKILNESQKKEIAEWIESHPDFIISALKHRENIVHEY
jgi:hypothetical protein